MANTILIRAVNGNQTSKPIKVFITKDIDLPKQFVLRVDLSSNRDGEEQLKLNNINYGLIASHDPAWLTEALTGFRRDQEGTTFVIAEQVKDDMPAIAKLSKVEAY